MSENKIPAKLPRVGDRTEVDGALKHVLMIEDDPAELDAYARGLWQQWQALDGVGVPLAKRYTKTIIKAAFAQLMGQYHEAEAPIPYELVQLSRAVAIDISNTPDVEKASTSPVRASSEKAYWAAIRFEATHPASAPASRHAVAKHLCDTGVLLNKDSSLESAKGIVRDWRKLPDYNANVRLWRHDKS